jgi:transcriptional regulator
MYVPAWFAEDNPTEIGRLIRDNPLGTLVTLGSTGIEANHIPFLLREGPGPHGTLCGHVARNNAVWHDFDADREALVIFGGPSAYISPNWYPTKGEGHRVVPTYNYATVHAYGHLRVHDDEKWLRAFLGRLTQAMEASQPKAWEMGDAPQDYLQEMIANVVGIEIAVTRLIGKWKVGQNRLPVDREGAAAGLRATGERQDAEMADLMIATAARVKSAD